MAGGKLSDMVGASHIVDQLCDYSRHDALDDLLSKLDPRDGLKDLFSRRAGGAFCVGPVDKSKLIALRRAWRLLVMISAPGLTFTDAIIEANNFSDTLKALPAKMNAERNLMPQPDLSIGPYTMISPRTGALAIGSNKVQPVSESEHAKDKAKASSRDNIGDKFYPQNGEHSEKYFWPITFEAEGDQVQFPLLPGNNHVGIVHADGNALGQLIMKLGKLAHIGSTDIQSIFRDFSQSLSHATQCAAQEATNKIIKPHAVPSPETDSETGFFVMPARPLILGGDDMTIIVRSDLALSFTSCFLTAFREKTKIAFDKLKTKYPCLKNALPDALSAGAGVLYVNKSHPFDQCAHLAEVLAKNAKSEAKNHSQSGACPPSAISIYRMTFSLSGSTEEVKRDRHTVWGEKEVQLGHNPYYTDPPKGYPSIAQLETISDLFGDRDCDLSAGPLRQALSIIKDDPQNAKDLYKRWRDISEKHAPKKLGVFDKTLSQMGDAVEKDFPIVQCGSRTGTPLADIFALKLVEHKPDSKM